MLWMKKSFPFLLALFFSLSYGVGDGLSEERKDSFSQLIIKGKKIWVQVARTEDQKSRGLMFREKLGKDEGMLFIYDQEGILSFWMKNTPIPLSIAFIDGKGRIVDIQDMEPFSLQTHVSAFPARYALEMNQGWFQKNGIKVGDVVSIPSTIKKSTKPQPPNPK